MCGVKDITISNCQYGEGFCYAPGTTEDDTPSWEYGPYGQCGTNCKKTRTAICKYPSGREVPSIETFRCGISQLQANCNYGEGLCVYTPPKPSWKYGQFEFMCRTDCKRYRPYTCEYPDGSLCGSHTQSLFITCSPGEGGCPYVPTDQDIFNFN